MAKPHLNQMRTESGRVERLDDDDTDAALVRVETVARLMDSLITIPGTNVRVGLDAVIGLVPVIGDVIGQAVSAYIIWEARRLGVSRWTMARMLGNSAIDAVVGVVPLVGDAFDIAFRANLKNLALLKAHIEKQGARPRRGGGVVIDGTATRVD